MSNQSLLDMVLQVAAYVFLAFILIIALIWILGLLGFIIEPLWKAWESRVAYKRQRKIMLMAMYEPDHDVTVEHIQAMERDLYGDDRHE